jgi:hypothetical protein
MDQPPFNSLHDHNLRGYVSRYTNPLMVSSLNLSWDRAVAHT